MKKWLIKMRKIFLVWGIVALVVWVGVALYFKPWGTELGVPGSPKRTLLAQVMDPWVLKLPWILFAASIVAARNKWLAPRGRYQDGVDYPIFSPYVYTAVAFMSALFAASGIIYHQVFDLPSAPAAIASVYFNPIVSFLTLWIGGTLRAIVFGQGEPVTWFLSNGITDGTTYIFAALFYWWFRESRWGGKLLTRVIFWAVMYYIWTPITLFPLIFWYVPSQMYASVMVQQSTVYLISGVIAGVAGVLVAEAMIKVVEGRRRPATIGS